MKNALCTAIATCLAVVSSTPSISHAAESDGGCKLQHHVGIACVEEGDYAGRGAAPARNAAILAEHYGFDFAKIRAPYTRQFLAQFDCTPIRDDGPVSLRIGVFSKWRIATEDGYVVVDRVEVRRPERTGIGYVADIYLSANCIPSGDQSDPLPG